MTQDGPPSVHVSARPDGTLSPSTGPPREDLIGSGSLAFGCVNVVSGGTWAWLKAASWVTDTCCG